MGTVQSVAKSSVLIFEDSATIQELFQILMAERGYKAQIHESPLRSLLLPHDCGADDAPCRGFNLLITDDLMPVMTGTTFLEYMLVNQTCRLAKVPIIIISATAEQRNLRTFVQRFPQVVLMSKPFSNAELFKIIGGLLEKSVNR